MKEQKVILKNIDSFEPKHIFECGQCFRWDENFDGSYTGVVGKSVLNVYRKSENIIINGISDNNLNEVVIMHKIRGLKLCLSTVLTH